MTPERFARLRQVLESRQPDLTVLADGVHKSHNIAAIVRTCDAVGIRRMHVVSSDGTLQRHHMVAGGSRRWVDTQIHATTESAYAALRESGWRLVIAHAGPGSIDYRDVDYTSQLAVVLGAELRGPSTYAIEHADQRISIPMQGMVESLNVSVAAAVILFEAQRQRMRAGLYAECRIPEPEFSTTLFEWAHPEIARRCRERGLAYPPLSDDGDLLVNPLGGGAASNSAPSDAARKGSRGSSRDRTGP